MILSENDLKPKLPITAIIVGLNEAHLLQNSLPALSFCDDIMYFDLGSKDNSIEIAQTFCAQVISHSKVDSCEWIHAKYATKTKNEWILITDPDEVIDDQLAKDVVLLFKENKLKATTGAVSAPWQFYFNNKKLKGTVWGGINSRILLAHNKRFDFLPLIHAGRRLRANYEFHEIKFTGRNIIHHYWMQSFTKLIEKHLRYLRNEGEARFETGQTTTINQILWQPLRSFRSCYILRKGYKDGFYGIILSIFWAWYNTYALIKLYKYKKQTVIENHHNNH